MRGGGHERPLRGARRSGRRRRRGPAAGGRRAAGGPVGLAMHFRKMHFRKMHFRKMHFRKMHFRKIHSGGREAAGERAAAAGERAAATTRGAAAATTPGATVAGPRRCQRASVGKISAKCCSFSAVSAPILARKYAFCSILQNLPDYQAGFFEIRQNFANCTTFAKFLLNLKFKIFTKVADFSNRLFAKILRLQRCKSVQIL